MPEIDSSSRKFGRWEYYVEKIDNANIPVQKKEAAIEAIYAIQGILGVGWLEKASREGHKIVYSLLLAFNPEFLSEWLPDFVIKLKVLESVKGFNKYLLGRLRNSKEYPGAEWELELASRIALNGYTIEFTPEAGQKRAEFSILTEEGPLYLELKSLQMPQDERRSSEYQAWGYELAGDLASGLHGQVHQELSDHHRKEIGEKIQNACRMAKLTGAPQEVLEQGVITAIVVPNTGPNNEYLFSLLRQRNLPFAFHGPDYVPWERDERIRSRIMEAKEQLPKDRPGIIVVCPRRLLQLYEEMNLESIANMCQETVLSEQNVVACALIDEYYLREPNMKDEMKFESNYVLLKQIFFNAIHEHTLVVKNKFSRYNSIFEHVENYFKKA